MRPETPIGPPFFEITCDATFDDIRMVLRQLDMRLKSKAVDDDTRGTAQLVLAEAMNNIVEHAYAGTSGTGLFHLRVDAERDALRVTLNDAGAPMPWSKIRNPGILRRPLSPEYASEGGYGWSIIKSLTQNLDYERLNDQNYLSFNLSAPGIAARAPGTRRRDAKIFEQNEKSA